MREIVPQSRRGRLISPDLSSFRRAGVGLAALVLVILATPLSARQENVFRAGAGMANITPPLDLQSPIAGDWANPAGTFIHDELWVRSLVLDDGRSRVALLVVDNIGVPRYVLDEGKRIAQERSGLPAENILVAATHTHSAASARGRDSMALEGELDGYQRFLAGRIGDAVQQAVENLEPARIGWGSGDLPDEVFNRRWFMKPGTALPNPFDGTDQVRMNPGVGNPDILKPAGPTDPEIVFLWVRALDGRSIALLANYSLHYVGGVPRGHISADYFAVFAERIAELLGERGSNPSFVAMMSNGTSGNINNIDYRGGQRRYPPYGRMRRVADRAAAVVLRASHEVEFHDWVPLRMVQRDLTLATRQPDERTLARARKILADPEEYPRAGRPSPQAVVVYAESTLRMARYPPRIDVPLQALGIGELAVTAIPFEVFVETGLQLKRKSPFEKTFTISLANGSYGYLPTPEHHRLGGYETWLGTSRVEVDGSTKIVQELLRMLEEVRRSPAE